MQRRFHRIGRRFPARAARPVLCIAAGLLACSDLSPTGTDPRPAFAPGGGGPPVRVNATDPSEAEQGTTLSVRVLGSNFEPGAVAEFKLDGVPPGKVRTNSTTFISPDELVADITVDADAELGLYDVEVTLAGGKKGVGTELFRVKEPSGAAFSKEPISMTITDLSGQALRSDGEGNYIDQDCGVYAWLDGVAMMHTDAAKIPRTDRVRCGDGRHGYATVDGITYELSNVRVRPDSWDHPTTAIGTVNASPLCAFVNGNTVSGKGMRFDPDGFPGSDRLNVLRLEDGGWRFWTSPYPDNKGWCEDASGIHIVHFDLDVTVRLR